MRRWQKQLHLADIFHDDDTPFPERRDEMVRRVRLLDLDDCELQEIADELAEAADGDEWDVPWDAFYDWANAYNVWVVTR